MIPFLKKNKDDKKPPKSTVSRTLLRAKRRLYQCLRYAL